MFIIALPPAKTMRHHAKNKIRLGDIPHNQSIHPDDGLFLHKCTFIFFTLRLVTIHMLYLPLVSFSRLLSPIQPEPQRFHLFALPQTTLPLATTTMCRTQPISIVPSLVTVAASDKIFDASANSALRKIATPEEERKRKLVEIEKRDREQGSLDSLRLKDREICLKILVNEGRRFQIIKKRSPQSAKMPVVERAPADFPKQRKAKAFDLTHEHKFSAVVEDVEILMEESSPRLPRSRALHDDDRIKCGDNYFFVLSELSLMRFWS